MSAKRALFTTPSRASKRRRTAAPRRQKPMRIPKALLPEMKVNTVGALTTNSTNYAFSSIPTDLNQGDDSNQFIGTKFRISRIRVHYDFSQVSLSSGVRILLVIPKDPSITPSATLTATNTQVDPQQYTVVFDRLLPDSVDTAAGTFDWSGPLNVEMAITGASVRRNNIHLLVFANNNGANMQSSFAYTVWYTDN